MSSVVQSADQCRLDEKVFFAQKVQLIAEAYLAVEQIARSPLRQWAELSAARLFWAVGVMSPVRTLGIAQISEDTFIRESLRNWLTENIDPAIANMPFWVIAENECYSLAMIYRLVQIYLDRQKGEIRGVIDALHGLSLHSQEARDSRLVYDYLIKVALEVRSEGVF